MDLRHAIQRPVPKLTAKFVCRLLLCALVAAVVIFEFFYFAKHHRPITTHSLLQSFVSDGEPRNSLDFRSLVEIDREIAAKASESCRCKGELFCFPGVNSNGETQFGRPFPCTTQLYSTLAENRLLESDIQETPAHYETLDAGFWTPVFMTSVSTDHFAEARTFMQQLRKFYPTNRVVIFDLGLSEENLVEARNWCNVEIHAFDFDRYPPHLRHLRNFAFKLVLLDALKMHRAFFYFDTSVLVQSAELNEFLRAVQHGQLMPFSIQTFTYHSVFAATNPRMYEFLPVPPESAQIEMAQSTAMLVLDSPYTRRVMKWWTLCALTPDCLTPADSNIDCAVARYRDRWHTYMKCHRFDQSFWNLYSIAELYGPKQMAVRLNYTETFDRIDLKLAKRIEHNRNQALNPMFKRLIKIKRANPYDNPLELPCATQ